MLVAACALIMCKAKQSQHASRVCTHPGAAILEINCCSVFTSANAETQSGEKRAHEPLQVEVSVISSPDSSNSRTKCDAPTEMFLQSL